MSEYTPQSELALREIYSTYGDRCHIKPKSLHKFGRTASLASDTEVEISRFQDAVLTETLSTTNDIDSIVSTSTSDNTQTIRIEGHTVADGNLTFVTQTADLNGQTRVPLTTPLVRATRGFVTGSGSALAGDVAVYVDGALTSGKPNTDADVKLLIAGTQGRNQSEKCATAFSQDDYFLISELYMSIGRSSATVRGDFILQIKEFGNNVWRPQFEITLNTAGAGALHVPFEPYLIVPPNHDVRMICIATGTGTATAAFGGKFALKNSALEG